PPTITFCPADITIECTASTDPDVNSTLGVATATDACDMMPEVTYMDATVAGECPQEYTITRTWTVADDCDNATNCVQIISVEDSTPPVLTCPANLTLECDATADLSI